METFLMILERYGIPLAVLIALAWHHLRTLSAHKKELVAKDEEIKRIQEARLADSNSSGERMLKVVTDFTELTGETNTTLKLLAERLSTFVKPPPG